MTEFVLKGGDKVYYPKESNEILATQATNDTIYPLFVIHEHLSYSITTNGKYTTDEINPSIFPATQEWYEKLVQVYPNLEPPPKRKNPKEVIQAMLDDGWYAVPVFYLEGNNRCIGLQKNTYATMSATPFDPKTGKTIIDFVGGEVILED